MTRVCHFVKENGFRDMQLSNLLLSKITEFRHFCWFLFPVISGNCNCSFELNGLLLVTMWNGPFNSKYLSCNQGYLIRCLFKAISLVSWTWSCFFGAVKMSEMEHLIDSISWQEIGFKWPYFRFCSLNVSWCKKVKYIPILRKTRIKLCFPFSTTIRLKISFY